ncbi:hypothetical protein AGMMS49545_22470 [Betaproteobacteria bacterium]|nr:hypothetical protein AGMMS49545_22460 [Betaproteobacteria bacterium]GHT96721.1 hypothetical protein AGMMS49545_22470 [Betaproteobacteria bacterium]
MNIAQLAHVVSTPLAAQKREARRLGPRKVTALMASKPDQGSGYALQELLYAVQDVAQGEGGEAAHAEALALAADLVRMGAGVEGLLQPSPRPRLDTQA